LGEKGRNSEDMLRNSSMEIKLKRIMIFLSNFRNKQKKENIANSIVIELTITWKRLLKRILEFALFKAHISINNRKFLAMVVAQDSLFSQLINSSLQFIDMEEEMVFPWDTKLKEMLHRI